MEERSAARRAPSERAPTPAIVAAAYSPEAEIVEQPALGATVHVDRLPRPACIATRRCCLWRAVPPCWSRCRRLLWPSARPGKLRVQSKNLAATPLAHDERVAARREDCGQTVLVRQRVAGHLGAGGDVPDAHVAGYPRRSRDSSRWARSDVVDGLIQFIAGSMMMSHRSSAWSRSGSDTSRTWSRHRSRRAPAAPVGGERRREQRRQRDVENNRRSLRDAPDDVVDGARRPSEPVIATPVALFTSAGEAVMK